MNRQFIYYFYHMPPAVPRVLQIGPRTHRVRCVVRLTHFRCESSWPRASRTDHCCILPQLGYARYLSSPSFRRWWYGIRKTRSQPNRSWLRCLTSAGALAPADMRTGTGKPIRFTRLRHSCCSLPGAVATGLWSLTGPGAETHHRVVVGPGPVGRAGVTSFI